MKLLELTVEGFRGAPDGRYAFGRTGSAAPEDIVVLWGPQGCGKTSLLEAIVAVKEATGSYGPPLDPARLRRRGASSGFVQARWWLTGPERVRAGVTECTCSVRLDLGDGGTSEVPAGVRALFETFRRSPEHGKCEYFPASRSLPTGRGHVFSRPPRMDEAEAALRVAKPPDKYASVVDVLIDAALRGGLDVLDRLRERGIALASAFDGLAPFRRALATLVSTVQLDRVEHVDGSLELRFAHRSGASLRWDDLSEVERQAVLFATTFVDLGLVGSLVLIDTPELHVAPERQRDWVGALAALGPDNQLIVASSSPVLRDGHHLVPIAPRGTQR